MRISDWSSDVCSSDLRSARRSVEQRVVRTQVQCRVVEHEMHRNRPELAACFFAERFVHRMQHPTIPVLHLAGQGEIGRATSELQSLMRISYAVFCLKKKNKYKQANIEFLTISRTTKIQLDAIIIHTTLNLAYNADK